MGPENNFVPFKHLCWFLLRKIWSSFQPMYAGKRFTSNPNSTKRWKLDRVAPVDNRPPNDKNGGRNSGDYNWSKLACIVQDCRLSLLQPSTCIREVPALSIGFLLILKLHYTAPHYTALHYTVLNYTALYYTTLHYTTMHYTTLQCTTRQCTTLYSTGRHFTTLRLTEVHYAALHCMALH